MNKQVLYRCKGNCGGVANMPKNCGADRCDRFGKPLEKVVQCEHCADQTAEDGGHHACVNCESV